MSSPWRAEAAKVVKAAIEAGQARNLSGPALLKHVRQAYPFGPRANHPYKIWLSEVNRQLGRSTPKPRRVRPPSPGQPAFTSIQPDNESTHGPPPA